MSYTYTLAFLPRDALLGLFGVRQHVRLSVFCLSVTLVDFDHTGWKSWKLIAQTVSPTPSLFGVRTQNAFHLLPGEHGVI